MRCGALDFVAAVLARCAVMGVPPSITALTPRTAEVGAWLERWANLNSGSNHLAGLERMRAALRADFTRAFPAARVEEPAADAAEPRRAGARALRLRMRPQAAVQVLLCGHYDTVYEADHPFQGCRWLDATSLNGPGVADMKGGILTLLVALQAFEQTPQAERLGWEVLLTPDEEIGSPGSVDLLREAARRNHFGLVFEPARPSGDIVHSRKGTGTFTAVCHGRAAHAAKVPNDGRNAVLALAEFVLAVAKLPAELPGVLVSVANLQGGTAVTNVVPDFAQSDIDVRVTKMAEREAVLQRLHALVEGVNAREGFRLELRGGFNRPPKEPLAAEEAAFPEWQRAARDLGLAVPGWIHTGGGSDGNFLAEAGLPSLDGVGPVGDFLHSDREVCRVDTLVPRAQIAALFLHRLASGEITFKA